MARRRWWMWIGLVIVVLIGGWVFWRWLDDRGPAPALVVSHETTWITEPLNKDGTVNYVAYVDALARQGVTPDNNAAIKYLQAVGPQGLRQNRPAAAQRVLQALALKLPPDGKYFVPLDDFIAKQSGKTGDDLLNAQIAAKKQAHATLRKAWTAQDYSLLDQWVTANQTSLDLFVDASKLEKFYVPPVSDSDPPSMSGAEVLLDLSRMENVNWCLGARALRNAGAGRLDEAWADARALYRFGRLQQSGQRPPIRTLIGRNVEAMADDVLKLIVVHDGLNSAQATAMLKDLRELPDPGSVTRSDIEDVRLFTLDDCQSLWRSGQAGFDCNYAMIITNDLCDACTRALGGPDYATVVRDITNATNDAIRDVDYWANHKALFVVQRFIASRRQRDKITTRLTVALMVPRFSRWYEDEIGCRASAELAKAALALAAHRADTGQFPDSLAAIAPKYLPQLPQDPYTAKPLLYHRDPDGGCVVYSVGKDMKDDGGVADKDLPVHLGPKQK